MQLRHLGIGLLIALTVLFLAGSATAHDGDTPAPVGDDADDWATWMAGHMGPDHIAWMEQHMGTSIEEMGAYMAANGGPGNPGIGVGGCH